MRHIIRRGGQQGHSPSFRHYPNYAAGLIATLEAARMPW